MIVEVEAHEAPEDNQDGDERHHGVHALDATAVGAVAAVGEPSVVGSVVRRRAEECHHAVHHDREQDAFDVGEGNDRDAPDEVARAHERLAPSDLVRDRAHHDRRHSRHHRARHHHRGDVAGRGVEHFIDKDIQIHVLDDPCHLTHQTEDQQRRPEPPVQLLLHRNASLQGMRRLRRRSRRSGYLVNSTIAMITSGMPPSLTM